MFICKNCRNSWNDDEGGYWCDKCLDGDFTEHYLTCAKCYQDFECEEDSLPLCDDCYDEICSDINTAVDMANYEAKANDEEPMVNDFFVWLLGKEKIHEILYNYCKEVVTADDIKNYITNDYYELEHFLRERFDL